MLRCLPARAWLVMITRLGKWALHCNFVITAVRGCIPFFKWVGGWGWNKIIISLGTSKSTLSYFSVLRKCEFCFHSRRKTFNRESVTLTVSNFPASNFNSIFLPGSQARREKKFLFQNHVGNIFTQNSTQLGRPSFIYLSIPLSKEADIQKPVYLLL